MMEIVSTGEGRHAGIAAPRPDAAFVMVLINGRVICCTSSELYRDVVNTLLSNVPEHGTPYVMDYTGAEFVRLFDKAIFERLDAMYHEGATPEQICAQVDRDRAVLLALRDDETNRAFWPEVEALLNKLGVTFAP